MVLPQARSRKNSVYLQPRMLIDDARAAVAVGIIRRAEAPGIPSTPSATVVRNTPPPVLPALLRGRRPIVQKVHPELIEDNMKAWKAPFAPAASVRT